MDSAAPVNVWLPQDRSDLGIYKKMLSRGAIRPFEMPEGIERLAERVMMMMEMAQESGRLRDAMKAAEILRMLAADNRDIALQLDRIERLDAGKPTQINGQVSTEAQDRIKRIVSTQRSLSNTEAANGTNADGAHPAGGAAIGRFGSTPEVQPGGASARGDHAPPQDGGGDGTTRQQGDESQ